MIAAAVGLEGVLLRHSAPGSGCLAVAEPYARLGHGQSFAAATSTDSSTSTSTPTPSSEDALSEQVEQLVGDRIRIAKRRLGCAPLGGVVDGEHAHEHFADAAQRDGRDDGVLAFPDQAELLADARAPVAIRRLGLPDRFIQHAEDEAQWREAGIDAEAIVDATLALLGEEERR